MAWFSGYDSESIGFDSVSQITRTETEIASQTTEYSSKSIASQTTTSKTSGIQTSPENENFCIQENYSANLNAFLQKVVPVMMEALTENELDFFRDSSDSDDEQAVHARLYQVLENPVNTDENAKSSGDGYQKTVAVLGLSWSSTGNTLALSLGRSHHDDWCDHEGLIRVYTTKRSAGDKLRHLYDITQNNCITVLQYHPVIAAVLAYATTSGEVVVRNLRNANISSLGDGCVLTSPPGCHGSRRVSVLKWADVQLTKSLLMMQQPGSNKRRGASDQVLISAGTDGSINIWQVNPNLDVFSSIICYQLGGDSSTKLIIPDITSLDFKRVTDSMETDPKIEGDVFVVGCKSGQLILCHTRASNLSVNSNVINPIFGSLESHHSCVLEVAFSTHKPGILASMSTDSELRVYNIDNQSPLNVICVEETLSCMMWIPNNPYLIIVGLGKVDINGQMLIVYNISNGRRYAVEGLSCEGENVESLKSISITTIAINSNSQNFVAVGDNQGNVRVWDIPIRHLKLASVDSLF